MKKPPKRYKIELSLSLADHLSIRKKFGKAAASVAKDFLLGFRVANPNPPARKQMASLLRMYIIHRQEVIRLRKLVLMETAGADSTLAREEGLFNKLTQEVIALCSSNFSEKKKVD